jgi:hypothetical protein
LGEIKKPALKLNLQSGRRKHADAGALFTDARFRAATTQPGVHKEHPYEKQPRPLVSVPDFLSSR